MNSTQLASRLMFTAKQCRDEANLVTSKAERQELIARARTLTAAFRVAYRDDPEARAYCVGVLEAAIDCLVDVITARGLRELTKGTP
jgi:hypothetical protein